MITVSGKVILRHSLTGLSITVQKWLMGEVSSTCPK